MSTASAMAAPAGRFAPPGRRLGRSGAFPLTAGRAERECEAAFYLGEFALLAGQRDDALSLLRQAGSTCPTGFTERYAARGELARLSAQ